MWRGFRAFFSYPGRGLSSTDYYFLFFENLEIATCCICSGELLFCGWGNYEPTLRNEWLLCPVSQPRNLTLHLTLVRKWTYISKLGLWPGWISTFTGWYLRLLECIGHFEELTWEMLKLNLVTFTPDLHDPDFTSWLNLRLFINIFIAIPPKNWDLKTHVRRLLQFAWALFRVFRV
jgi:hypothetical protein